MKKIAFATIAVSMLFGGTAFAADMAVKAPPAVAPVYSWTGCYIGGDLGGYWDPGFSVLVVSKAGSSRDPVSGSSGSFASGAATVHGGCNYQFASRWVAGIEADFTWPGFDGNRTAVNIPVTFSGGNPGGFNYVTTTNRGDGLVTARARLGYAFDRTMVYGTVGAAWIRRSVFGESAAGACLNVCDAVASFTDVGAVGGVGVEYAATNWLLLRAEYLYAAVGATHSVVAACPGGVCSFSDTPHTYTWRFKDVQQLRLGASVKFGPN